MFERLLVPLDGSDISDAAVAKSVALAKQLGAQVVGFVVEPTMSLPNLAAHAAAYAREADKHESPDDRAKQLLARLESAAQLAGVPYRGLFVRAANVEEAIAQAATENEVDMIVMVTHGRGTLGELVFGAHTKGVLERTKLPLLVFH